MAGTMNKGSLVKNPKSSGGGGGGSTDYTDLSNKPSINSVTLIGNKSSSALGLQSELDTQTAYTSQGTSTKVPQITTNSLGQVTGITEVDISFPVVAPTVLTDQTATSMALAGNTIYKWTSALTSLSFASAEVSDLETVLYFTTGETITWQDNSNLKWGGDGSAPSLEANTIYCISIRNGLAEIDTFGTVS